MCQHEENTTNMSEGVSNKDIVTIPLICVGEIEYAASEATRRGKISGRDDK